LSIQGIRRKIIVTIVNVFMMIFSLTCVFPIIWMFYSSLKTQKEFSLNIISLPQNPNLNNFVEAIRIGKMQNYFLNSVFTTIVSVSIIVILGFITGYFLSRFTFKGRNILYILFLSGMLIPVHGLLIPLFIQFKTLHLLDQRLTLILPYVALGLPLAIFLFESFIKSIPVELEEAAFIDGCTLQKMLFSILLPMCRPVLSTIIIMSFLHWWNEFPFALVLIKSDKYKTLPLGLANFSGAYSTNYTQLLAGLVIATLPVIIVYFIFRKRIIQGMTAGAVKG